MMKIIRAERPIIHFYETRVGDLFALVDDCIELSFAQSDNLFMRVPENYWGDCDCVYPKGVYADEEKCTQAVHMATGYLVGVPDNARIERLDGEIRIFPT